MASLDIVLEITKILSVLNYSLRVSSSSSMPSTTADVVVIFLLVASSLGYLSHGRFWDKPDPYHHIYFDRPQLTTYDTEDRESSTRDIARKLSKGSYQCVIFWGSQSGTSERFAETLGHESHAHFGVSALVADLSDYDASSISKIQDTHFVIFILSTYGEGDPSDNATGLWDWMKQVQNENTKLDNLRYLALGLGNSNYKHYNRVIDVVSDTLDAAGAIALIPLEKADDAIAGTEEDFQTWKESVFALYRRLGYERKNVVYRPIIQVNYTGESTTDQSLSSTITQAHEKSSTVSDIVPMAIKNTYELFTAGDRNCLHIELDPSSHDIIYKTGDHIGIWPSNSDDEVDLLLAVLGVESRRFERIVVHSLKPKVPVNTTLDSIFRHHLEICAPVPRKTVLEVAQFAPTPEARSMLLDLGRDRTRYTRFLSTEHLTLARLLKRFSPKSPWTSLPIEFVIENLLSLQPRYYSISSSSVTSPRRITITALVINKTLEDESKSTIFGLASNYLLSASGVVSKSSAPAPKYTRHNRSIGYPKDKILAHVRKSKFKLPITSKTPLILIGAGTGLAPFRAFLQERAKLHTIGKPIGRILLFFGCRNEADFIYREEILKIQALLSEKLTIFTAFSRGESGNHGCYVQDKVQEHAEEVLDLLDSGANLYICGKARMAREVDGMIEEAAVNLRKLGDAEAKSWTGGLKKRGRWKADVWG